MYVQKTSSSQGSAVIEGLSNGVAYRVAVLSYAAKYGAKQGAGVAQATGTPTSRLAAGPTVTGVGSGV